MHISSLVVTRKRPLAKVSGHLSDIPYRLWCLTITKVEGGWVGPQGVEVVSQFR